MNCIFYVQVESGNVENFMWDVLFINIVCKQIYLFGLICVGEVNDIMIYCNEDMGWIWLFYFKFDSCDLQGEVQEYILIVVDLQWVIINYYGWWNCLLMIFLNVILIKLIEDLNIWIILWFNIVFFVVFVVFILFLWVVWYQFCECNFDLVLDKVGDCWDQVEVNVVECCGWVWCWLDIWCKK